MKQFLSKHFRLDPKLGIPVPAFDEDWEDLPIKERENILSDWETVRGRIPDRIRELESEIEGRQWKANEEDDWPSVCRLYTEISDLASAINELNLWYRTQPDAHLDRTE